MAEPINCLYQIHFTQITFCILSFLPSLSQDIGLARGFTSFPFYQARVLEGDVDVHAASSWQNQATAWRVHLLAEWGVSLWHVTQGRFVPAAELREEVVGTYVFMMIPALLSLLMFHRLTSLAINPYALLLYRLTLEERTSLCR